MVVEVLGTLCVGVAHQSHQGIQMEIANADALPTLVKLMRNCKDPLLQVLIERFYSSKHKILCFVVAVLALISKRSKRTSTNKF